MASTTRLRPAFNFSSAACYRPTTATSTCISHAQASLLRTSTLRGQFTKRIRHSTILHPHISTPPLPSTINFVTTTKTTTRTTPTASLLSSLTSVASTGAGIFILGFIVFIHESGHYLAARLQGIRVKNFSIGFGPALWSGTPEGSETEFTIRLLPLGGYVAFPDHYKKPLDSTNNINNNDNDNKSENMNNDDNNNNKQLEIDDDPNLLQNRPVLDRALVISAGVIANVILAWIAIFSSVTSVGLPTYDLRPGAVVSQLVDESGPAARDGLKQSDVILSLNDEKVTASLDSAGNVAERIRTSRGKSLNFSVRRGNEIVSVLVNPKCCLPDGSSSIGVQLVPNAIVTRVKPSSPLQIISMTNKEFSRLFKQTWKGLSSLFKNFKSSSQNLSGPIGVVSMGADLARNDTAALFTFCAVISINLALINSLPLPALDGGQMTFLLIEVLRGAPVSLKVQDAVNRTALVLLLAFSGVLFFGDLERLNIFGALTKLFG